MNIQSLKKAPNILSRRFLRKTLWKNEKVLNSLFDKNFTKIDSLYNFELNSEISILKKYLMTDQANVKVLGDSLTAGVGVWTYHTADTKVIFNNEIETIKESPKNIQGGANYLYSYLKEKYPNTKFENFGLPGKSTKWVNKYKEQLINNEDVLIISLGTNDRWDCDDLEDFNNNLVELLKFCKKQSKLLYVFAPPPVGNGEEHLNFGMSEVNDQIKIICTKEGIEWYSHFDNFQVLLKENQENKYKYFEKYGSHPIQQGYIEMWLFTKKKLGI